MNAARMNKGLTSGQREISPAPQHWESLLQDFRSAASVNGHQTRHAIDHIPSLDACVVHIACEKCIAAVSISIASLAIRGQSAAEVFKLVGICMEKTFGMSCSLDREGIVAAAVTHFLRDKGPLPQEWFQKAWWDYRGTSPAQAMDAAEQMGFMYRKLISSEYLFPLQDDRWFGLPREHPYMKGTT